MDAFIPWGERIACEDNHHMTLYAAHYNMFLWAWCSCWRQCVVKIQPKVRPEKDSEKTQIRSDSEDHEDEGQ